VLGLAKRYAPYPFHPTYRSYIPCPAAILGPCNCVCVLVRVLIGCPCRCC